jgi:hypothetical protein
MTPTAFNHQLATLETESLATLITAIGYHLLGLDPNDVPATKPQSNATLRAMAVAERGRVDNGRQITTSKRDWHDEPEEDIHLDVYKETQTPSLKERPQPLNWKPDHQSPRGMMLLFFSDSSEGQEPRANHMNPHNPAAWDRLIKATRP